MKVWTSEKLAVSLAGHDKGNLYVVLDGASASERDPADASACMEGDENSSYFFLADGRCRTLEHPKKKKKKHVQVITHLPESLLVQMREISLDAHVRKILKAYRMMQETQKTY